MNSRVVVFKQTPLVEVTPVAFKDIPSVYVRQSIFGVWNVGDIAVTPCKLWEKKTGNWEAQRGKCVLQSSVWARAVLAYSACIYIYIFLT